jgi:hypothetical protein
VAKRVDATSECVSTSQDVSQGILRVVGIDWPTKLDSGTAAAVAREAWRGEVPSAKGG